MGRFIWSHLRLLRKLTIRIHAPVRKGSVERLYEWKNVIVEKWQRELQKHTSYFKKLSISVLVVIVMSRMTLFLVKTATFHPLPLACSRGDVFGRRRRNSRQTILWKWIWWSLEAKKTYWGTEWQHLIRRGAPSSTFPERFCQQNTKRQSTGEGELVVEGHLYSTSSEVVQPVHGWSRPIWCPDQLL